MRRVLTVLSLSFLVWLIPNQSAPAGPPTNEEVQSAIDRFFERRRAMIAEQSLTNESWGQLRAGALDDININELTVMQMISLNRAGILDHEVRHDLVANRIRSLMDQPTSAGAGAAALALEVIGAPRYAVQPDEQVQIELIRRAVNHPGLSEALRSGEACTLFGGVARQKAAARRAAATDILAIKSLLTDQTSPLVALGVEDLVDVVRDLTSDEAIREEFRARCVALARRALDSDEQTPLFSESEREWLTGQLARLDGAAARGQLLSHAAPNIEFNWSYPKQLNSLADLKGKVVVLEFWATWCGPCVASIPNVRQLAEHYRGLAVEIIGVTSIQGSHVDPAQGMIDTKGDPQRECSLMQEYIEKQGITWTIAFSKQDVFNPDYGVRGIPHVAIIDPAGVVRHRALHPAKPIEEKIQLIDALLREFDLPTVAGDSPQ